MLDTIGVKHFIQNLPSDDFKRNFRFLSRSKNPTWVFNSKTAETLPNLTIVQTPNGIHHFSAQVSLPKMIFGHNARLPNQSEVNRGLKLIAEYAEEMSGLPFDAETAVVSLVHYAYDIDLTESGVWRMIEKLSKRRLKPLRKNFYEDSTIYFTSKGKTKQIRIYPKLQEVLKDEAAPAEAIKFADGRLRLESCLLQKSAIDSLIKKYGLPDSRATTLLAENISDLVTANLLDSLDFFNLLGEEKNDFEILRQCFTTKRAISLFGFREAIRHYGEGFYKDSRHGISKSVYFRNLSDCRKAKI